MLPSLPPTSLSPLSIAAALFIATGAGVGELTVEHLTARHGAAQQVAARQPVDTAAVSAVLDEFHEAASRADGDAYFELFAEGGVFIGTDATEHWTVAEFRDYARPYFDRGVGWTYVATLRHVYPSPDGETAWFDELLENESLGLTRGTGVLIREQDGWKVAQYHLTIPIPNEIAGEIVERIREAEGGG